MCLVVKSTPQHALAHRGQRRPTLAGFGAHLLPEHFIRFDPKGVRPYREATQLTQNKNQLRILDCAAPGLVRLRAPGRAQDMALYIAAAKAARMHARPEGPRRHGGEQTQGASLVGPLKRLGPGGLTMSYPQPGAPKGPHPIVRARRA